LSTRRRVYERAHKRCEGCRKHIRSLQQMNAHHLRRFIDGGLTRISNLACLCKPCHRLLHERWPIQKLRWHVIGPNEIPRKHQKELSWVFKWNSFIRDSRASIWGRAHVWDRLGVQFTEYRWKRGVWRYRICRTKRMRSIKQGRRLMNLLLGDRRISTA